MLAKQIQYPRTLTPDPDGARAVTTAWIWAGLSLWAMALLAGFVTLNAYASTPGEITAPPHAAHTGLPLSPDGYTLVMAYHPMCSCSNASVYELERLKAQAREDLRCVFLIYTPGDGDRAWFEKAQGVLSAKFPDARLIADPLGERAADLGARTSGSVVLYSPAGDAKFWGGITPSRGHAGDSVGADSVRAIVRGRPAIRRSTRVFGCPLDQRIAGDALCETGHPGQRCAAPRTQGAE